LILETSRTCLRPFQLSDAECAFAWFSDPEVMRFIPQGADPTIEAAVARITRYLEHESTYGYSKWIILERESETPIGDAGLFRLLNSNRVELGYRLSRAWWNRGLATEVASRWVEVARPWYGFDEIYAFADPRNEASIRVMKKVGFAFSHREQLYGMEAPLFSLRLNP
jgi:ribosomal-protein-alanine N-acetyltransferase